MLFNPIRQRRAGYTQQLRGAGAVGTTELQGLDDELFGEFIEVDALGGNLDVAFAALAGAG